MIIDSHCHLNYEPMSNSLAETISRANKDGIKYMLTISTEDKSFHKILKIVSEYQRYMELINSPRQKNIKISIVLRLLEKLT